VLAGLRRHAAASAPEECCGALIGAFGRFRIDVRAMVPVATPTASPTAYQIDADAVRRLERQATFAGVNVVGFYHSHPTSAAEPSSLDLELAVPGYLYMIIETTTGAVRAWQLRDDRASFDELTLPFAAGAA
jgi:proteasome lid subunit RPN8/RPN11